MRYAEFNNHSNEKKSFVNNIFDNISKRYDLLNGILSLGVYKAWHSRLMKESGVKVGGSVIDFCTGTGELLIKFYSRFKISHGVGIDISQGMLDIAQQKIDKLDNARISFELKRVPAENTGIDEQFDAATIAFALRNVSDVQSVFDEMARVVRPGGKVLALELTTPKSGILKRFYKFYLKGIIPTVGGLFSKNKDAYKYLGESIINFPEPSVILEMMGNAGLSNNKAIRLTFGAATLFVGEK